MKIVVISFALMLVGSYLDNLRGVVLPEITNFLGINYSESSWLLSLGNLAAAFIALSLIVYLKKFSLRSALFWAIAMMAGLLLAAPYIVSLERFLAFAFLWGGTLTAFGTLSNLMLTFAVAPKNIDRAFAALHVMYGAGSFIAPALAGGLMERGWTWIDLMNVIIVPTAALMLWSLTLPKMERAKADPSTNVASNSSPSKRTLIWWELLVQSAFATYVAGEVLGSMWMTTYLVEAKGLTVSQAAPYISGFFVAMAITRLLTFIFARASLAPFIMVSSLLIGSAAMVLGLMGLAWGLALLGLVGPVYPLLMGRLTRVFSVNARRVTITSVMVMQLTLVVSHYVMGQLIKNIGVATAFWSPILLLVMSAFFIMCFVRATDKA